VTDADVRHGYALLLVLIVIVFSDVRLAFFERPRPVVQPRFYNGCTAPKVKRTLMRTCATDTVTPGYTKTAGCTTGFVNYANEPNQAALERSSQDAYDVNSSCVDSRRCGAENFF